MGQGCWERPLPESRVPRNQGPSAVGKMRVIRRWSVPTAQRACKPRPHPSAPFERDPCPRSGEWLH